ncbi:MAG: hypothetical protein K1X75_10745 [Leptospirales bacterium]|nr:hypothetical protein [Leptospirales bacterium]
MAFTDPFFILGIAGAFFLYWLLQAIATESARNRVRIASLLVGSLALFLATGPVSWLLLVGLSSASYFLADAIWSKRWLIAPIFFVPLILAKLSGEIRWWGLAYFAALPGVSFYSFQNWAYIVDRGRGQVERARSLYEYLAFISFSPQLVAGPIVVFGQVGEQIRSRKWINSKQISGAICLLLIGYAQKALLADRLAQMVDPCFSLVRSCSSSMVWLAALAYALQIYLDFSAYSMIAIGLGRLFGLRLPENFDHPYHASGVREFWRRWHMTLSTWLRDYVYIPLGGSRNGQVRAFLAVLLTMALGGLWHGGRPGFLIWGCVHGIMIGIEQKIRPDLWRFRFFRIIWRILSILFLIFSWLPFRIGVQSDGSSTLEALALALKSLVVPAAGKLAPAASDVGTLGLMVLLVALGPWLVDFWKRSLQRLVPGLLVGLSAAAALLLVFSARDAAPFLYFVF